MTKQELKEMLNENYMLNSKERKLFLQRIIIVFIGVSVTLFLVLVFIFIFMNTGLDYTSRKIKEINTKNEEYEKKLEEYEDKFNALNIEIHLIKQMLDSKKQENEKNNNN